MPSVHNTNNNTRPLLNDTAESDDAHTRSCCKFHGCKYNYVWCPVLSGAKKQKTKCGKAESCQE